MLLLWAELPLGLDELVEGSFGYQVLFWNVMIWSLVVSLGTAFIKAPSQVVASGRNGDLRDPYGDDEAESLTNNGAQRYIQGKMTFLRRFVVFYQVLFLASIVVFMHSASLSAVIFTADLSKYLQAILILFAMDAAYDTKLRANVMFGYAVFTTAVVFLSAVDQDMALHGWCLVELAADALCAHAMYKKMTDIGVPSMERTKVWRYGFQASAAWLAGDFFQSFAVRGASELFVVVIFPYILLLSIFAVNFERYVYALDDVNRSLSDEDMECASWMELLQRVFPIRELIPDPKSNGFEKLNQDDGFFESEA